MKVEIDLPELPEGYEYTGEFRVPHVDEHYRDDKGRVMQRAGTYTDLPRRLIIRQVEVWEYPEWLGGAGVVMNRNGEWFHCDEEPQVDEDNWIGPWSFGKIDNYIFPLWKPPRVTDWRKSWRPNPKSNAREVWVLKAATDSHKKIWGGFLRAPGAGFTNDPESAAQFSSKEEALTALSEVYVANHNCNFKDYEAVQLPIKGFQ